MKRKHLLLINVLFISVINLFATEAFNTEELLLSYLENDIDLQKATLAAEKSNLAYESAKIDNGIDITISTGVITFKTTKDGLSVKTVPSVKMTMPNLSNLSVTTQSNINTGNKDNKMSDTSISVSMDIISSSSLNNEISMQTAQRNQTTAMRTLQTKAIEKEKAFYLELKGLLNSLTTIIQSKKKLYTDINDFESIKVRGFSESSSTYRTAELQVLSDRNTIESQTRAFLNDYMNFYKKCNKELPLPIDENIINVISDSIPKVEPIDITTLDRENYIELENAVWTKAINDKKRGIDNTFSLSANAGYTFDNTMTNSDTINLGVQSVINGVNLQGGINIPIKKDPYPTFTLSAGVYPNTFRKNEIKQKQESLAEQQEALDIKIAENNYDNFITSSKQTLEELLWRIETTEQNYEMYKDLENDMQAWYKKGIVPESDYLSAFTNAYLYKVRMAINNIDLIIYNNDISRKFISNENN